ncbi:hypothetical protein FACS189430_02390 [Bacteroidia bacterium]|nr:hypothetical protein FACS189430_02390 [Bacteroidia bacterium]
MLVNKKAVLGMLVAIVMSLGVMGGISQSKAAQDVNLVAVGATYYYQTTHPEMTAEQGAAAGFLGVEFSTMASVAIGFCWGGPAGIAAGIVVGL